MILTSDAATILRELDVVHPAAKLLVMASQQQDAEMGDGTNLVIVLAGELLKKAEELIRMGLKTSDIVSGYEKAQNYALKVLEGMLFLPEIGHYDNGTNLVVSGRSRGRSAQGAAVADGTQQGAADSRG
jgi:chaperonin GroEL (HSP60 family)